MNMEKEYSISLNASSKPIDKFSMKAILGLQSEEIMLGNITVETGNEASSQADNSRERQQISLGNQNGNHGIHEFMNPSESFTNFPAENQSNDKGGINICENFEESKDVIKCKLMACFKDINYCFS